MEHFDTTSNFISNHVNSSGYAAGDVIKTYGYSSLGGVGGSRWKATGNIIAASQDPLALNDIKLSDASGNEFELMVEESGIIDLNVLGGTSASYENIATNAGLTFSQGLTSDISNDIVNIDLAQSLIDRNGTSVGEAFMVADRANGIFDAKTGLIGNGFDILQSSTDVSIQYELRIDQEINLKSLGITSSDDIKAATDRAITILSSGGKIFLSGLPVEVSDTITISTSGIELDFTNCTVNPVALFPGTEIFNFNAADCILRGLDSTAANQDIVCVDSTASSSRLKIFDTTANDFGGRVINSDGDNILIDGFFANNCQSGPTSIGAGVIRMNGNDGVTKNVEITNSFGKGVSLAGNNCTLSDFRITTMNTETGSGAGGMCFFVSFNVVGATIKRGIGELSETHICKLSGGSTNVKISDVVFINTDTIIDNTTPNALLEMSGTQYAQVSGCTFDWTGLETDLDAIVRMVFHTAPNVSSSNNLLTDCHIFGNDPSAQPICVQITGSAGLGLPCEKNVIDGCYIEGKVVIGSAVGDTDNTMKNCTLVTSSFQAVTCSSSTNTVVQDCDIRNDEDEVGDDYCIRSDGSTGLTVKNCILRGKSTGIRSNDPNIWITNNDFNFSLQSSVAGTIRYINMTAGSNGVYANNTTTEVGSNLGEVNLVSQNTTVVNP